MEVFGVSFDPPAANRAFAEKHAFPFRLLCDTERAMGTAFRACERASDAHPRRITYVVGPEGDVEQATATVDPGSQAAELLASLARRTG